MNARIQCQMRHNIHNKKQLCTVIHTNVPAMIQQCISQQWNF